MSRAIILSNLLAFASACAALGGAQAAEQAELRAVVVRGDTVTIQTSGPVKYKVLPLGDPPRLIIDLLNTRHAIPPKTFDVDSPVLKFVRTDQFSGKPDLVTRVVLQFQKPAVYHVRSDEGGVTVRLGQAAVEPRRFLDYASFIADPSGRALEGTQRLLFTISEADKPQRILWSDTMEVAAKSGAFHARLGEGKPLPDAVFGLGFRIDAALASPPSVQASSKIESASPALAPNAPKPASPAPARAAVRYWVQVGSFSDGPRAEALSETLKSKGHGANVFIGKVGGVSFNKVRIGPFQSRAEALTAAQKLAAQGNPVVVYQK